MSSRSSDTQEKVTSRIVTFLQGDTAPGLTLAATAVLERNPISLHRSLRQRSNFGIHEA